MQKCLRYEKEIPVDFQVYYRDSEKKTGALCLNCKQGQRKELEEKLKRLQEDQESDKQELERIKRLRDKEDLNNDNNNPNTHTHTERERESNLLSYFTTNNIDSARIDNNKLFIKYNYKAEEEEEEEELNTIISNSELQKIKDYLAGIPTKSITKTELESKSKQDSSNPFSNENEGSNLGLYLGLGVVGIAIFILGLVIIKKYRKKY